MAITATLLTSGSNTNNATTVFDTASFTPTAGSLVIALVQAAEAGMPPDSLNKTGMTWTLRGQVTNSGNMSAWTAIGSGTAGVLSINVPVQDGCLWAVIELAGADTTAPIVATGSGSVGGTATSITVTMPTPASGSATVAGIFTRNAGGITPGTGYTELTDVTMSGPASEMAVQWRADASTSVTASWPVAATGAGLGLEVKAAGGATEQHETGGSTATVTTVTAGGGTALEAASGGSTAAVATTTAGAGSATEAASGGSGATVTTTTSGAGAATEAVTDGSAATVTTQTTGEGTALEHASGGSQATVTTLTTGGGSGTETEGDTGGSTATVLTLVTGGGTAAEHAAGGSAATVTTATAGDGSATEHAVGGSNVTVSTVVTGGGSGTEESGEPIPYRDITARRLPATHVAVRLAPTHTTTRATPVHTTRRIPATHTARRLP